MGLAAEERDVTILVNWKALREMDSLKIRNFAGQFANVTYCV